MDYGYYGANVSFEHEGFPGYAMQYTICNNLQEFWHNYDDGEGQDPDNMTYIYYKDGSTWCSDDLNENPKRTGIQSACISAGWGFVCYNCTPTSYEDEYGMIHYDVELN